MLHLNFKPVFSRSLLGFALCAFVSACGTETGVIPSSGSTVTDNFAPNDRSGGVVNGFHRIKSTSYDEFDRVLSTNEMDYDLDQNLIFLTITSFDVESDSPPVVRNARWFYDDFGRLTETERPTGNAFTTRIYSFNDNGTIAASETRGSENEDRTFTYDADGRVIRSVITDLDAPESSSLTIYTYVYDENGSLSIARRSRDVLDENSGLLVSDVRTSTFTINQLNQVVRKESLFSGTDDLLVTLDYSYDAAGNVIEIIDQDNFGYFARVTFEYARNEEPIFNFWTRIFRYFP